MLKFRVLFYYTIVLFVFTACNDFKQNKPLRKEKKSWIYIELETILKKDTTVNYLYGKVNNTILDKLERSESNTLFKISDIRYFNNDDLFQLYKDDDEKGILYFNTKSIRKISIYERDPIYSFDKKDLHPSTLALLK